MATRARVRAPELIGKGGWLNTGDQQYTLADLRGRIVILDFWTFCCVNCLHVLDELRELEEKHRDTVVIIGVHSPKFVHEAEHQAVVDAVERYEVHHPVLDDPELATWKQYAVRAWPTLVVIDPEGYVVAQHAGEGHAHAIEKLVEELETEHAAKGTLRRGDGPYVAPEPVATHLRFPGKALLLPDGGFLVSDTTRHRLVELDADGETVRRHFGTGERGLTDGGGRGPVQRTAGARRAPGRPRRRRGHSSTTRSAPWTSRPGRPAPSPGPAASGGRGPRPAARHARWTSPRRGTSPGSATGCGSPWRVCTSCGRTTPRAAPWASPPGPPTRAWSTGRPPRPRFAQPSGLAVSADGERLWVADSETSALRWVDRDEHVHTAVGTGLFDFGHRDGAAEQALLQHPIGVTARCPTGPSRSATRTTTPCAGTTRRPGR